MKIVSSNYFKTGNFLVEYKPSETLTTAGTIYIHDYDYNIIAGETTFLIALNIEIWNLLLLIEQKLKTQKLRIPTMGMIYYPDNLLGSVTDIKEAHLICEEYHPELFLYKRSLSEI